MTDIITAFNKFKDTLKMLDQTAVELERVIKVNVGVEFMAKGVYIDLIAETANKEEIEAIKLLDSDFKSKTIKKQGKSKKHAVMSVPLKLPSCMYNQTDPETVKVNIRDLGDSVKDISSLISEKESKINRRLHPALVFKNLYVIFVARTPVSDVARAVADATDLKIEPREINGKLLDCVVSKHAVRSFDATDELISDVKKVWNEYLSIAKPVKAALLKAA